MRARWILVALLMVPSVAWAAGTTVCQGGTCAGGSSGEDWTANKTISNTAPSLALTDTTASAKSLTMVVDANLAQLRESAGASGSLLVLDLANNRVGIGTTAPGKLLNVKGAVATDEVDPLRIELSSVDTGAAQGIEFYRAGLSGALGAIRSEGEAIGTNSKGALTFYTNSLAEAAPSEKVRITSGGNVGIGTTGFGTSAAKVLGIGNGTAPTTSPANMVQLWAADVAASSELRVRDEAGNVTTLSPHPTDILNSLPDTSPLPWVYRSNNDYLGVEVVADMAGLAAAVEQLTGKTFVTYRKIPRRDWDADQQAQVVARQRDIDAATQAKAQAIADAEAESDEAKRIERRREAEAMTIPAPYTPKPAPAWMSRRIAKESMN